MPRLKDTEPADFRGRAPHRRARRRETFDLIASTVAALHADHPTLDAAQRDLAWTDPLFDDAVRRMQDARPALPGAASYDGPNSRGGAPTSSTERHATTVDRTANDRLTLDAVLRHLTTDCTSPAPDHPRITRNAWTLRRLISAWSPRNPTDKQRAEVERTNAGNPECEVTRELLGIHEPAYRTSDLRGLLPVPTPVGRWLYDESKKLGRLPTPNEMRRWASRKDETMKQLVATKPR